MNPALTSALDAVVAAAGRFIAQASAAWARAGSLALAQARAHFARLKVFMDTAHRLIMERIFARKMAARRFFLSDPRNPRSAFSKDGRMLLAHWAKQAHVLNPSYSPNLNAEMKGMQKMLAVILADIFDDLPNFVQAMAEEEARLNEEIVRA